MTYTEIMFLANAVHCFLWFGIWSTKDAFNVFAKIVLLLAGISNLLFAFGKLP